MSLTVDVLSKPEDHNDGSQLHLILEGLNLQCVAGWFDTTNPVVTIAASCPTITGAVEWETVYTSEPKLDLKEGAHPRWNTAVISLHALCHSDLKRPIRIRVDSYSYSDNDNSSSNSKTILPIPMGYLDTTVENILQVSGDARKTAKLRDPTGTNDFGSLIVRHARIQKPRTSRSGGSTCSSSMASHWRQSIRSNMSWSVKSQQQQQQQQYPTKRIRNSGASSVSAATTTAAFSNSQKYNHKNNSSQRRDSSGASVSSSVWHTSPISNIPIVIPDEMLDSDAVLRLTLEADLIFGGNTLVNNANTTSNNDQLATLMESVAGGWNTLGETASTTRNNGDGAETGSFWDMGNAAGWMEATTAHLGTMLGTTNPYFQISTLTDAQIAAAADDDVSVSSMTSSMTQQQQRLQQQTVYRSEPIMDTVAPLWKSAVVPLYLLCGGDLQRKFRISIFSKRDDILSSAAPGPPVSMGYFDTSVMELKHAVKNPDEVAFVPKSKDGTKQFGTVRVVEASLPEDLDVSVGSDCDDGSEVPPLDMEDHQDYNADDDHSLISEITGHVSDMGASMSEVTTDDLGTMIMVGEPAMQEYYQQDNERCEDLEGEINEHIQNLMVEKEPNMRNNDDSKNKVETQVAEATQKKNDNELNKKGASTNNKPVGLSPGESQDLDPPSPIRYTNLKQEFIFVEDDSPKQQTSEEQADEMKRDASIEGDTKEVSLHSRSISEEKAKSSDAMVSDKGLLSKSSHSRVPAKNLLKDGTSDEGKAETKEQEEDPLHRLQNLFMSAVQGTMTMTSGEGEGDEDDEMDNHSDQASRHSTKTSESAYTTSTSIMPDVANKFLQVFSNLQMKTAPVETEEAEEEAEANVGLPMEIEMPLAIERDPDGPPVLYLTLKGKDLRFVGTMTQSSVMNPLFQISASSGPKSWSQIYKSEHVPNSVNPRWKEAGISIDELCKGDLERPVRVSLYSLKVGGGRNPMGFFSTNVAELLSSAVNGESPKSFGSGFGSVIVMKADIFPPIQPVDDKLGMDILQPQSSNDETIGTAQSSSDVRRNDNLCGDNSSHLEYATDLPQVKAQRSKPGDSDNFLVVTSSINKRVSEVTWSGGDAGPIDEVAVLAQNSLGRNTEDAYKDEARVESFETFSTMDSRVPSQPTTMSTSDIFADFAATLDKMQENTNESLRNDALLQSLGQSALEGGDALRDYKSPQANSTTQRWKSQSSPTLPSAEDMSQVNSTQPWISQSSPTLPSAPDVSYRTRDSHSALTATEEYHSYGVPETTDLLGDFARTLDRLNTGGDMNEAAAVIGTPSLSETKPLRRDHEGGMPSSNSHELEQMKERLKQSESENNELKKSIENSETTIRQLRGEASIARAEKDAAETALKNHEEGKDLLMSFNNGLLDQLSALEAKVKQKELLLAAEHEQKDKLLSEKLALERQLSETKQEKETLEHALMQSRATMASSKIRLAETSESLSRLKVENEALSQSNEDQKRADALAMKKLREENEGLVDTMMKLQAAADDDAARLNEKDMIIARCEEERKQHLHDNSILTESLDKARADATSKLTQLQEVVNVNDRVIVNMKLQMDSLNSEKAALEAALAEAQRETEETTERLRRETDEGAARHREVEVIPERREVDDMTFEARLAEKSRMDRRSLETTLVETEINLIMSEERARTDAARINALTEEVNALKSQKNVGADPNQPIESSSEEQALIDGLRKECQALTDEKNALAKSLQDTEELAKSCKDDLLESNKRGMMLSESVRARDRMVEKSQHELETLTQEKQALQLSLNKERLENEAKLKEANNRMTGNVGEALKATLQQAGAKVKFFEQKAAADASKIKELSNRNNELHARLQQVERLLREHSQNTPQLTEALKEKEGLITELKAQNSNLESKLQAAKSDKESLVTACRALESSTKEKVAEAGLYKAAENKAVKLQEELDTLNSKIPRLEADAKSMFENLMEARTQISDLEASLRSKDSELQSQLEIVEALKKSRDSGSETAASREQLAEMEAERDAALKTTKKLESKLKELKKDLDGAIFAKGIYEGYWKDANTKIEEMKGFHEVKKEARKSIAGDASAKKSVRKSMSVKSKASDDGTDACSKRSSKSKKESSLRKSVKASLEGKGSEHSTKRKSTRSSASSVSSRSTMTMAAAAASLLGIAERPDDEEEEEEDAVASLPPIPKTIVSTRDKSSLRRASARVPRPSAAETRKSVRKSVRASASGEEKEKRKPRKSTMEEKQAREAARSLRSSTRKSLREASAQSSEGKKPRARIDRSKITGETNNKLEKKPRRKTEVIPTTTKTEVIPTAATESPPSLATKEGAAVKPAAASVAPPVSTPDDDVDLT